MAALGPPKPSRYYQLAEYNKVIASTFIAIDVLAVGLRVIARRKQKVPLQLDDYLIFVALVLTLGSGATLLQSVVNHNMGYAVDGHSEHYHPDVHASNKHYQLTSKAEYAMGLLLTPALCFIKLSFLAFYKRIFCVTSASKVRHFIHGMMVFVSLWGIAYTFAVMFECGTNFTANWGSNVDIRTKCVKTLKLQYSFGVTDFVTDFVILVIPMPLLLRLQLKTSRKIAVGLVFLLGFGAVAMSAIRLAFTVITVNQGFGRQDSDLNITGMMSWLQLEAFLGIVAACAPTIRFIFKGLSPESVINSIRSALSLHSLHSNHSRINDDEARIAESRDSNRDITVESQVSKMEDSHLESSGKSH